MKYLIVIVSALLICSCSSPKAGQYVGGEDRCYIASPHGCHMKVVNGYTAQGVGVDLEMVGGKIGGGKAPSIRNKM